MPGCSCSSSGPVREDAGADLDGGDLGLPTDVGMLDGDVEQGSVDAGPCGVCRPPQRCRFDTCVPNLGTCTSNTDCTGDAYCSAAGECLPYGVPPEVINDPMCQRTDVVEEVIPTVQCQWGGPSTDDPNPASALIYTSPIIADLNLDLNPNRLQPSVVMTTWYQDRVIDARIGTLRIFDGRTCAEQLQIGGAGDPDSSNRPGYGTQWAVADLDGDVPSGGRPEIIGFHKTDGNGNTPLNLYALALDVAPETLTPSARRLWYGRDCTTDTPIQFATNAANLGAAVFDLNDDAVPEILVGTMVFDAQGCLLNAFQNINYLSLGELNTVADVDLDGVPELVAGNRIAEWDPVTTEWVDEAYFTAGTLRIGHVAVVDLGQYSTLPGMPTPNNLPEVVVVTAQTNSFNPNSDGTIRAQTLDGTVFLSRELYHSTGVFAGHGGAPTASDFDGDDQVEFAAAANEFYAVYDPDCDADPQVAPAQRPGGTCTRSPAMAALPDNMGVLWAQASSDFSSSSTGSSIFDFDGNGSAEAVYRDECYLRVYDGASGDVIFSTPASSGTGLELPAIADVDGDFATEIVVPRTRHAGCPSPDPLNAASGPHVRENGFVILRDPEDRWAASRPIWNQHAYSVTHVSDDAQVVRTSEWEPNWTQAGLNNFRQNVQGDLGVLNIADLTVVFFQVDEICNAQGPTSLELRAQVCNRGTNSVQDGVAVNFEQRPSGGPVTLVCDTTTTRLLSPGECEQVSCTGTVQSSESLTVTVDPNDEVADCNPGNDEGAPAVVFCFG